MLTREQLNRAREHFTTRGLIEPSATDEQVEALALEMREHGSAVTSRPISFRPSTINDEARSVDIILATEEPVVVFDFTRWDFVDEILLMDGFDANIRRNKLPLLDAHQRWSIDNVLGSITEIKVDASELDGVAVFSETAEKAWTLTREGHLDGISVGYQVNKRFYIDAGETMTIDGRTFTASPERDLKVVTSWSALEGSMVPIGADPSAGTRSKKPNLTRTKPKQGSTQMNRTKIIEALQGRGYTQEAAEHWADTIMALDEGARQSILDNLPELRSEPAAPPAPPASPTTPPPAGDAAAVEAARIAEAARVATQAALLRVRTIDTAVADMGVMFPDLDITALANTARATSEISVEQFRSNVIVYATEQGVRQPVHVSHDEHDNAREIVEGAILTRTRADLTGDDNARLRAAGTAHRGCRLLDLARICLERGGDENLYGMTPIQIAERAINHTTGDFALSLSNTANKILLASFEAAQGSWRTFAMMQDMNDFKQHFLHSFSHAGTLEETPEGSPSPHHTMTEKRETITLKKFSEIFAITMEAIINDDMSVFNRIIPAHGLAWATTINQETYRVLNSNPVLPSDGIAVFQLADHANLDTTTADVTDKATADAVIRALEQLLLLQVDLDGETPLNLTPRTLLTSIQQKNFFIQALRELDRADNNRAIDIAMMNLDVVWDAQVSNPALGGAAKRTYLFADPLAAPVIAVGFLNGDESPVLTDRQGFEIDGIEMKVRGQVAVAPAGYRGAALHQK